MRPEEAPNGRAALTTPAPSAHAPSADAAAAATAGTMRAKPPAPSASAHAPEPDGLFVEKASLPSTVSEPAPLIERLLASAPTPEQTSLAYLTNGPSLSGVLTATAPQQTLSACNLNLNLCYVGFDSLSELQDVRNLYSSIQFSFPFIPATPVQTALDVCSTDFNSVCSQSVSRPMSIVGLRNDLEFSFPDAVAGLSFHIASIDNNVPKVAMVRAYDGTTLVAEWVIPGNGTHLPVRVDFANRRVTRVRVSEISDNRGFSYDDFAYSIIFPGAPGNLRSQGLTGSQVTLLWNASSDANGYVVQRSGSDRGPWSDLTTTTDTRYVDTNLTPGVNYYYRVGAFNLAGYRYSAPFHVATPLKAPFLVDIETFPNDPNNYKNLKFLFNGDEAVESYNFKRSRVSGGPYEVLGNMTRLFGGLIPPTSNTWILDAKELNTTFFYVITASRNGIESPPSNELAVNVRQTCGYNTLPTRPAPQQLRYHDWTMRAEVSDRDGLVLRDLALNGRYISEMISLPYLNVSVRIGGSNPRNVRVELTYDNPNPLQLPIDTANARLVEYDLNYTIRDDAGRELRGIKATYMVDHLFPSSVSCLKITMRYLFGFNEDGGCELSSTLPCARFYPVVNYEYSGKNVEFLNSIEIPQRIHNRVENNAGSSIGLFRDCDTLPVLVPTFVPPFIPLIIPTCVGRDPQTALVFTDFDSPVRNERADLVVKGGRNRQVWDNVHQTNKDKVGKPFPADLGPLKVRLQQVFGGCPECYHSHWRWSTEASKLADLVAAFKGRPTFGGGNLLGFDGHNSNQDMELAVVRYSAAPNEVHPTNYRSLLNGENLWRQNNGVVTKQDTVLWYVTRGTNPTGNTMGFGAFANWNKGLIASDIQKGGTGGSGEVVILSDEADNVSTLLAGEDGPTSVTYEFGYKEGPTTYTPFDPAIVGPVPDGYTLYNSTGYEIKTEAEASGTYVVTFTVPSAADLTTFNKLRILQAKTDPFNPDAAVWADQTILGPDPQGPDFTTKTIRVRTTHLGLFVLAFLNGQPVNTKSSDIGVSAQVSAAQVTAGDTLTYTINVTNQGPDAAQQVGLAGYLSPDVAPISATPGDVACDFDHGAVYCQLGPLGSGATRTVTLIVMPLEKSRNRFPAAGQDIDFSVFAGPVKEKDLNQANNSASVSAKALPNPNIAPEVKITSPADKVTLNGPANVTVTAEASDSDGTISKVEFLGDDQSIGVGQLIAPGRYQITWTNVGFGPRSVTAIATDSGGRQSASDALVFFVNGPATVNMTSPAAGTFLMPNSVVNVTATAVHTSGTISKVEFYANERLIGEGTASGQQYTLTWTAPRGIYDLSAVATDNSGSLSFSAPVKLFVTEQAGVRITEPADFTSFPLQGINFKAEVSNTGGAAPRKIEFYANGMVIGEGLPAGTNLYSMAWLAPPQGFFSIVAVMTDAAGLQWSSPPINIAVDTPGLTPGDLTWVDDAVPQGARTSGFRDDWYWSNSNPVAISGAQAHLSVVADGLHTHSFEGANIKMAVNAGERLYAYVFLHPGYLPQELMLEWKDSAGWDHRAFWSAQNVSRIRTRTAGDASSHWMGPLPAHSRWVRLEVPAEAVGLAGKVVDGMSFDLYGGRAAWDRVGKTSNAPPTPATPGDTIWFDEKAELTARLASERDTWDWVSPPVSFSGQAHKTFQAPPNDDDAATLYRAHWFSEFSKALTVDPGDLLFTYAYLDPTFTPDELVVGWGADQGYRFAYWGESRRGVGSVGTETMRYMGPIPENGKWVRLEVPASYLGLEGKTVRAMYFGMNRQGRRGLVYWDRAGKSTLPPSTTIEPLHLTTPLYRFLNEFAYSYFVNAYQAGGLQPNPRWYAPNTPAGGTVPFYRYRFQDAPRQYFYTVTPPDGQGNLPTSSGWKLDTEFGQSGIAFHIYPKDKPAPPGTIPLRRYTNNAGRYWYTIFPDEQPPAGYVYQENAGYVSQSYPVFSAMENPIDNPIFFVKQHYRDFLGREADLSGLNFWVGELNQCSDPSKRGPNETESACIERKRVDVSGAFFLSIEFKETGYLVYRLYNAALDRPSGLLKFDEFLADTAKMGDGVVVHAEGWEAKIEANKVAFISEFVARDEFLSLYPENMTPAQYVNALYAHAAITPSAEERQAAVDQFAGASTSGDRAARARVLRTLAESSALNAREINRAFVLMQYFGYLRRHPSDPPDNDLGGFNFWLDKLNHFGGDYRAAEMVKAFISAIEYRNRFGQPVTAKMTSNITAGAASVKAGAVTVTFASAASAGTLDVKPVYPTYLAAPPPGYAFYDNLAWEVSTTSSVPGPLTIKVGLDGVFNDAPEFANLRLLHLEDGVWVDRTILPADFNNRTISASVTSLAPIVVARLSGDSPPAVSITSPAGGQNYTDPAAITINATASSGTAGITRVEFLQGETVLGEDTTAPYSFTWNTVPAGDYALTARATDSRGVSSTSPVVNVSVNDLPAVFIASPPQNAIVDYPASVSITAYANDSNGVKQVEFFQGATSLGVDTTAPYGVTWNSPPVGTYTLTAVAKDNLNATTTSPPVVITVRNQPPAVSITSPADGAQLGNAPATVTVSASASDGNGVKQVEFFRDGVSLGVDMTAPYGVTWNSAAVGSYTLTARATDNLNATTTSNPVRVTVGNGPPTVSITSPSAGTYYNANASVAITATAADNEGIKKVEFFQGATKLGEDLTAPYSFTWTGLASGTYSLTARATDNLNAVTTSSAVNITVGGALFTLFSDDFNDNTLDTAKWFVTDPASATTMAERNQRLEITLATAFSTVAYNSYASVPWMDLTNAQVTIEVPQYGASYGYETIFQLTNGAGGYLMFDAGGAGLNLQDSASGSAGRTVISSYNTTQHRFWRFRHDLATDKVLWETSADGVGWLTQRAVARPFALTSMVVHLVGGKYSGISPPPTTIVYDNLKVESPVANNQPAVSITSPANGAVLTAPASATITANASDSDGSITRVEFLSGATSLGVDTTAPYSVTVNNAVAGTYTLTARATDNRGGITTSAPVNITVNTAPIVAMTMPASGSTYNAPATVTLGATASDADGTITSVEFFRDGTSLGVDTAAPYSVLWNNAGVGSYVMTAKATDNRGAVTTSSPVPINVTNVPPTISITSPASGTSYSGPASITIQAAATDNEGVKQVEFFQGATSLGVDTTAPYSVTWNSPPAGTYSLTAKATDNLGATATSSAVNVNVGAALYTLFADDFNDNALDTAKWFVLSPVAITTVLEQNQRLELTPPNSSALTDYNGVASLVTIDMTNAQVTVEMPQYAPGYGHDNFFQMIDPATNQSLSMDVGGGGLVLSDTATGQAGRTLINPYNVSQHRFWRIRHDPAADTLVWQSSPDGAAWATLRTTPRPFAITNMQLRLVAGHYSGVESPPGTTVFDNLKVESPNANALPTASITAPSSGAVFSAPASLTISANVADGDGTIRRVEFFSGQTSLGVVTAAPYSLTWNNVAAGSYALTARATDNRGGSTTTAPVSVVVNAAPTVAMTMPASGSTYNAPATITLGATASDADGTITNVEFFRNGVSLGVDTTSPYGVTWPNVAAGNYSLTARATDNRGAAVTSASVTITVTTPNAAPTVSLTAPATGSVYTTPAAINLDATASDSDGTITSVEFFKNGVSLGVDTTAPYNLYWTSVPAGSYTLTAKATDNLGATTTSAAVTVTVNAQPSAPRADTVGVYTTSTFYLRNSNTPGAADIITTYGMPGWKPVVGDWDGNGTATLGILNPDGGQGQPVFILSNRTDYSYGDIVVAFGMPGDKPVVGDWDGDGTVTVGVYRPSESTFYLRNSNTPGPADIVVPFLTSGDTPLAGDWDGDGVDTIGIHNSGNATFYLRNSNTSGPPNLAVGFGGFGDKPVVGDWDGDGKTTVGSYQPSTSTFSLRNTNTTGPADYVFQFGSANSLPVAGNWDGPRGVGCGDTVWFDDTLPTGAVTMNYNEGWANITNGPVPFSGKWAHSSPAAAGEHGHYFNSATLTLPVAAGDKLFAYVYLDPANPPTEVMLQWFDTSWEHRAYWGSNTITWGVDGTESRRYMGPLPPAGQWVRLEVPASLVGLEGATVNGISFNLAGGGAAWDRAGKTTAASPNILISEFRFRGAGGSADEFVELYNNSDSPVTVCATDGSGGWALTASDGLTRFTIPNATVLPARGHYLATASGYGLGAYAASDKPYTVEIADNTGVALFNTRNPAGFVSSNRFDAVGFSSLTNSLYFRRYGALPARRSQRRVQLRQEVRGCLPAGHEQQRGRLRLRLQHGRLLRRHTRLDARRRGAGESLQPLAAKRSHRGGDAGCGSRLFRLAQPRTLTV